MTHIEHLDQVQGRRVEGRYTLSDVAKHITQSGDPYKQLTTVDGPACASMEMRPCA